MNKSKIVNYSFFGIVGILLIIFGIAGYNAIIKYAPPVEEDLTYYMFSTIVKTKDNKTCNINVSGGSVKKDILNGLIVYTKSYFINKEFNDIRKEQVDEFSKNIGQYNFEFFGAEVRCGNNSFINVNGKNYE